MRHRTLGGSGTNNAARIRSGPGPFVQDRLRYRIRVSTARMGSSRMHIRMAMASSGFCFAFRISRSIDACRQPCQRPSASNGQIASTPLPGRLHSRHLITVFLGAAKKL
jgi:hypothetical protein